MLERTGVTVTLPEEEILHVGGCPRHLWVPPVLVDPASSSGDAILERGRAELARMRDGHPSPARPRCDR